MSIALATTCRVCDGTLSSRCTAREMYHGSREEFGYLRCVRCGCLQIESIPEDLARFYPDDYYTRSSPGGETIVRRPRSRLRRGWSRLRLAAGPLLRPFAGRRFDRFGWFTRTGTGIDDPILDAGCGSGKLLWNMHREGFSDLTGIDPNLGSLGSIDGGQSGPRFEAIALEDHSGVHALVMSHHSFEHVEDPHRAFEAFRRLVAPDGWLLLRIPLADGWAFGYYGSDWVQLDAPRHLHLHTRKSVDHLARVHGFRLVEVVDDSGPFQIWGSELYRRDIPLIEAARSGRPHLGVRARLAARIRSRLLRARREGDQACFYLQRVG